MSKPPMYWSSIRGRVGAPFSWAPLKASLAFFAFALFPGLVIEVVDGGGSRIVASSLSSRVARVRDLPGYLWRNILFDISVILEGG